MSERASEGGRERGRPIPSLSLLQASYHSAWYSVLDPVVEAARQLHAPKVWEDMSPKLYTTFWVLSLYDLYVPTARYEDEVRKAREAIKDVDDKPDLVRILENTRVYQR